MFCYFIATPNICKCEKDDDVIRVISGFRGDVNKIMRYFKISRIVER